MGIFPESSIYAILPLFKSLLIELGCLLIVSKIFSSARYFHSYGIPAVSIIHCVVMGIFPDSLIYAILPIFKSLLTVLGCLLIGSKIVLPDIPSHIVSWLIKCDTMHFFYSSLCIKKCNFLYSLFLSTIQFNLFAGRKSSK